jgi:hypothetical protein
MDIIKEASPLFDAPLLPVILKKRGTKVEDSSRGEVTIYSSKRGQGDGF